VDSACEATPTCPSGTTYNGFFCLAFASCPAGSSLDTTTHTCESCPSGTVSFTLGLCRGADPTCPAGATLEVAFCQAIPSGGNCPTGTTLDPVADLCFGDPICDPGFSFGLVSGFPACIASPSTSSPFCPAGATLDSSGLVCTADLSCPTGMNLVLSSGGTQLICQSGLVFTCPPGTTFGLVTTQCVAPPSCPPSTNFERTNELCVASGTIGVGVPEFKSGLLPLLMVTLPVLLLLARRIHGRDFPIRRAFKSG